MLVIGIANKILASYAAHTRVSKSFDPEDATALRGGGSRWLLERNGSIFEDATALRGGGSRWLLERNGSIFEDATALRGGGSRWLLLLSRRQLAANVRARNIAQEAWPDLYSSNKREPPQGKP